MRKQKKWMNDGNHVKCHWYIWFIHSLIHTQYNAMGTNVVPVFNALMVVISSLVIVKSNTLRFSRMRSTRVDLGSTDKPRCDNQRMIICWLLSLSLSYHACAQPSSKQQQTTDSTLITSWSCNDVWCMMEWQWCTCAGVREYLAANDMITWLCNGPAVPAVLLPNGEYADVWIPHRFDCSTNALRTSIGCTSTYARHRVSTQGRMHACMHGLLDSLQVLWMHKLTNRPIEVTCSYSRQYYNNINQYQWLLAVARSSGIFSIACN